MMEIQIGQVMHYYNHLHVAVLRLDDGLKLGDKIHIQGHATEITQRVTSMEVDHHSVLWAKPGDSVAVKVIAPVHDHDIVYRMAEEMPEPA
jgi:putative protease